MMSEGNKCRHNILVYFQQQLRISKVQNFSSYKCLFQVAAECIYQELTALNHR